MKRPHEVRAHWGLLALLLILVAALLTVSAVTSGALGEHPYNPPRGERDAPVPAAVLAGGPILDATHPSVAGLRVAPRTVVLTFDDGPSPYTPQVLDILEKFHVPATFFVIGTHVTGNSAALRRMVADGDEIGVHTFTHSDLATIPAWRRQLELDTTQLAIASATGYTTDLLRPPFSSEPGSLTPGEWGAITRAGSYRIVLADRDTEDWRRPGVDSIVAAAAPGGPAAGVVMLHDGGGNRSQTVSALKILIPELKARGYRFATVSHAIGVRSPWTRASGWQRARGSVVIGAVVLSGWLRNGLQVLFLTVGVLAVLRVLLLLVLARRHDRLTAAPHRPGPASLPGLSIVVPAFNEEAGVEACVRSLVACDYPQFEVIVVDDGSTDGTADVVAGLGLPGLRLLRQPNAGKPAALNAGIAAAVYDVLVLVDGDTVFERDALRELVAPLRDPAVGAVSGNTKVGNRQGLLGRWQHVEYVIGFNLDRRMFDLLRCMPTVPGAIGAFRRVTLTDVGGVSDQTLAEDTDLTMAICRAGWRVVYAPNARAWTEAPASLSQLWRQRYRWCYGTLQAMWKHRGAVLQRGAAGHFGRRGLPYLLLFQVLLPLLAPVIDLAALFSIITGDIGLIGASWLGFLALQFIAAGYAFLLDGERLRTLWVLPIQQFVYRQLMYLVVIQSVASALYGVRLRWHKLERTGTFDSVPRTVALADVGGTDDGLHALAAAHFHQPSPAPRAHPESPESPRTPATLALKPSPSQHPSAGRPADRSPVVIDDATVTPAARQQSGEDPPARLRPNAARRPRPRSPRDQLRHTRTGTPRSSS
ncbi:MAG: glycosyltransferase [Jatrophihabitans sp.]|uniref:bifunctional polysaccharide deacetylase/glycosyltransferase family 2 protein n=1 Tax=Jatrophihabitans sp. TaxID=1932789 RepID=UPI00390FEC7A